MQDIIDTMTEAANEIAERLDGTDRVITGTPWVIECCPGLYLGRDGEYYCFKSITEAGVIHYTPERVDAAVECVRAEREGVFDQARKVFYRDALRTELAKTRDIIARLQKHAAAAA